MISLRRTATGGILLALALAATAAVATPVPNSAVIIPRVFNDCPTSTLTTDNQYPASLWIQDENLICAGYANLHLWRFSENGTDPILFMNGDAFMFGADLVIEGTGEGESGLQLAPWWSQADGRFNVRTTDGEIACFGGRLPFYSFTAQQGLVYQKGTPIHLEIEYHPNSLNEQAPGQIEYRLNYNGNDYTSGVLLFDEGNPNEPYGTWGILDQAQAGAHLQVFMNDQIPGNYVRATWRNIEFEAIQPVPVEQTSWGRVKNLFR